MSINQHKKAERNSVLSAEARRILSILAGNANRRFDAAKANSPADVIAIDENGRPFFYDGNADFSISHSGSAVAVSLVQGKKIHGTKIRTGCDIQLVRPRNNLRDIAEENFCAAERDYIFSPPQRSFQHNETQYECARFFQIWTLKECYIKLMGLSVFDMPKALSFSFDRGKPRINDGTPVSFYLYELVHNEECYMLATAIEGELGICPEIHIFSHPLMTKHHLVGL